MYCAIGLYFFFFFRIAVRLCRCTQKLDGAARRLSTVRNADRIIVLENGRMVETGSHEELLHRQGLYYHLISNQLALGS
ncbi:MAG: hypothetical protein KatS3mg033_1944 [Thermonema sp.]|nr:MAG: hypothetical protein KatS3mg033_1944 [Thermonema sp.]